MGWPWGLSLVCCLLLTSVILLPCSVWNLSLTQYWSPYFWGGLMALLSDEDNSIGLSWLFISPCNLCLFWGTTQDFVSTSKMTLLLCMMIVLCDCWRILGERSLVSLYDWVMIVLCEFAIHQNFMKHNDDIKLHNLWLCSLFQWPWKIICVDTNCLILSQSYWDDNNFVLSFNKTWF